MDKWNQQQLIDVLMRSRNVINKSEKQHHLTLPMK